HHHFCEMAQRFAAAWAVPAWRAQRLGELAALREGSVPYRFACLNHKLRAHRAVILGRIFRRGWDRRGLVSCLSGPPRGEVAAAWRPGGGAAARFAADLESAAAIAPRLPLAVPGDESAGLVF